MTKDWNFNQPLESKSENQEDPDKIAALFGNHQGGNDVNYEAAFQTVSYTHLDVYKRQYVHIYC